MKRRDFLRHLGTLAAAPVIVPLLPAIAAETEAGVVYETYSCAGLYDDPNGNIWFVHTPMDIAWHPLADFVHHRRAGKTWTAMAETLNRARPAGLPGLPEGNAWLFEEEETT